MSKVSEALKKNKNIKWKYVNGVLTPFRDGKKLKVGTRPKELTKAVGRDLSNAFRDILRIPSKGVSGLTQNPNIKEYVKEKYSPTDKSPEANTWRELVKKNKETQALNEAKLEGLRIDRRSGSNIRTGTRNWLNPAMGPGYEESARLRKKAEENTKKYQEAQLDAERLAGWNEADLQDAKDLGAGSTTSGEIEWTTDQEIDEKGLFIPETSKPVTSTLNKKNPAAKSEYPKGDAEIPSGKKYPTTIGGKKTSAIQKKLLDAGHDPKRLRDLMERYRNRYKNKRGW
jgi:hypothetical protein